MKLEWRGDASGTPYAEGTGPDGKTVRYIVGYAPGMREKTLRRDGEFPRYVTGLPEARRVAQADLDALHEAPEHTHD